MQKRILTHFTAFAGPHDLVPATLSIDKTTLTPSLFFDRPFLGFVVQVTLWLAVSYPSDVCVMSLHQGAFPDRTIN